MSEYVLQVSIRDILGHIRDILGTYYGHIRHILGARTQGALAQKDVSEYVLQVCVCKGTFERVGRESR